jgi:hypothetical protein
LGRAGNCGGEAALAVSSQAATADDVVASARGGQRTGTTAGDGQQLYGRGGHLPSPRRSPRHYCGVPARRVACAAPGSRLRLGKRRGADASTARTRTRRSQAVSVCVRRGRRDAERARRALERGTTSRRDTHRAARSNRLERSLSRNFATKVH